MTMSTENAAALAPGASTRGPMVEVVILVPCVAGGANREPGDRVRLPQHEARMMMSAAMPQAEPAGDAPAKQRRK